jgi:hypothetical protein
MMYTELTMAAIALLLLCMPFSAAARILDAADFGVTADGRKDDGPAVEKMLESARQTGEAVTLRFPEDRIIRIETAADRYAFTMTGMQEVTIDGGGSTFLLGPHLRFLDLRGSADIAVRNLKADFDPLPFADGTVTAVNAAEGWLDVRLFPDQEVLPAGGPTLEDGEQAFFSMLWFDGEYDTLSRHYWTEKIEKIGPETIRVFSTAEYRQFDDIVPGEWRISVPVPGIAHRYGPGPCFRVHDNRDVAFENVELWSAPWFGFNIMRNRGTVIFREVHIRPKPGSGRLMSLWRDGFHVKGNRAKLRWDGCILEAMNDDAFNISTHSSVVRRVLSPTRIEVRQKYPLGYIPWREGAIMAAADAKGRRLLPGTRIVKAEEGKADPINGQPAAPPVILELDKAVPGLEEGTMVWQPETSNPDTLLKNCVIRNSCRMQSSVRLENCDVTALLWFYSEDIEGPYPTDVVIRDCVLRRGRGNPETAVTFAGAPDGDTADPDAGKPPRAVHNILIENNEIKGGFQMRGVENARLLNNRFTEKDAPVIIRGNYNLEMRDNTDARNTSISGGD